MDRSAHKQPGQEQRINLSTKRRRASNRHCDCGMIIVRTSIMLSPNMDKETQRTWIRNHGNVSLALSFCVLNPRSLYRFVYLPTFQFPVWHSLTAKKNNKRPCTASDIDSCLTLARFVTPGELNSVKIAYAFRGVSGSSPPHDHARSS